MNGPQRLNNPNKKKRSVVRWAQVIVGSLGALISFLGTMPLPESWLQPYSEVTGLHFQLAMTLAYPGYIISKLFASSGASTPSGPSSQPWGLCLIITFYNTVLSVLLGTIIGFAIKVVKGTLVKKRDNHADIPK
jgi:hypothetical protein